MARKSTTPKPKREVLEMLDGRVFFSTDNWQTVWQSRGLGRSHRCVTDKQEADYVRFLVVAQSSGGYGLMPTKPQSRKALTTAERYRAKLVREGFTVHGNEALVPKGWERLAQQLWDEAVAEEAVNAPR